ncbi:hypothetical protein RND71_015609 [Anisodus tanguticus]|uniref:Uncharacterized protein n=1 Tax=Anisodus tanguticus TaxID=243964 RepID=A0AAE1S881_9SOLA|nr:hypothetical protein RND71_015609 [Anisodus tanguticus]
MPVERASYNVVQPIMARALMSLALSLTSHPPRGHHEIRVPLLVRELEYVSGQMDFSIPE